MAEQIDWSKMLGAGHFRDRLRPAGPTFYLGRDKGMGIDQDDYTAHKKQLVATLEKFNVLERERDDVMTFISSIENDIVEKSPSSDSKTRLKNAPAEPGATRSGRLDPGRVRSTGS
jgi:hypothetical protein